MAAPNPSLLEKQRKVVMDEVWIPLLITVRKESHAGPHPNHGGGFGEGGSLAVPYGIASW